MNRLALLALLILPSFAPGQTCPDCNKTPAYQIEPWRPGSVDDCCCIVSAGNGGGSGTCVAYDSERKQGIVITAKHVVRGWRSFKCTFPDGTVAVGSLAKLDDEADVAAILVNSDRKLETTEVAADDAPVDSAIVKIGFPHGRHITSDGRVLAILRLRPRRDALPCINEADFYVNPGDSGCGVFDSTGHLVGVVKGFETDEWGRRTARPCCHYSAVAPIRRVLDWSRENWWRRRGSGQSPQQQYAPQQQSQPSQTLPPKATTTTAPPADLSTLEKRIAALEAAKPIAGPPGPAGRDGKDADNSAILQQLASMQLTIDALAKRQQPVVTQPSSRVILRASQ